MYSVTVLKAGYALWTGPGQQRASATATLIQGRVKMVVDTGLPIDRELILDALRTNNVRSEEIAYVVNTCGQSDHTGNNNLFPQATFFVSYDISQRDEYRFFDLFRQGQAYVIDEELQVHPTPGHSGRDLSVLVKTDEGIVAVTGDLFERKEDLENDSLWRSFSEHPDLQEKSRARILAVADFIVPGHGDKFAIREEEQPKKQRLGF